MMFLLFISVNFAYAQEENLKQDKKENKYQDIVELVKAGNFVFEADKTYPKGGTTVDLTTNPNYLKIEEGKVEADLPFWGETYHVHDMSGDAGINFSSDMTDYTETFNDEKRNVDIKFEVNTNIDKYSCFLHINYNGYADLNISSVSKSNARYSGKVHKTENK